MPVGVAVHLCHAAAFSPSGPSQSQPPAVVYQATQPRVEIGVFFPVKSASARNAIDSVDPAGVHARWPSVQKPFRVAPTPDRSVNESFVLRPACRTVAVAETERILAIAAATFGETRELGAARPPAHR